MFRICLWVQRIVLAAVAVLFIAECKAFAVVPMAWAQEVGADLVERARRHVLRDELLRLGALRSRARTTGLVLGCIEAKFCK